MVCLSFLFFIVNFLLMCKFHTIILLMYKFDTSHFYSHTVLKIFEAASDKFPRKAVQCVSTLRVLLLMTVKILQSRARLLKASLP